MELAVGLFALALVVSALCGFAVYIAKSLKMQNSLRVGAETQSDKIEFTSWAAEHVFGTEQIVIREHARMPSTLIVR